MKTVADELLTDAELCNLLRVSLATLRRHMRKGPPRKVHPNAGDIRLIHNVVICGKRRWSRASVNAFVHGK